MAEYNETVTSSVEFSQQDNADNIFSRAITESLELSHSDERNIEIIRSLDDGLGLNESSDYIYQLLDGLELADIVTAVKEAYREVTDGVDFIDENGRVYYDISTITLNQVLSSLKSKAQFSDLEISQDIVRDIILGRSINDSLNLGQTVRAYRFPASGGGGSYGRVVGGGTYPPGFVPLAGAEGCESVVCQGTQLSFSCPPHSLVLKLPKEHSKKMVFNKIDRYTIGKQLDNYQNSYPVFKILRYSFSNLNSIMKNNFISYYKTTAGLEMTLTDECNDQWFGVIITPVVSINQYAFNRVDPLCPADGGFYNLEFEFEAIKL